MSEVKVINLSQLDCDQFQKQGFIIQKPGTEQLWLGVGSNDDLAGARFFNNPFYAQDPVPFIPARLVACEVQEFLDWIGHYFLQSCKIQLIRSNDEQYLSDVENIIKLIHSVSGLKKLVAATKSEYSFSNSIHPISQAKKLMELNGSLYGKWKDGVGVLGVSPEPLFVQHNSTWSTTALAGTIKNDTSGYQKKLLGDLKEKEEHQLVIDDIVDKLTLKTTQIEVGNTSCVDFGNISHIKTNIMFSPIDCSSKNLINTLSPTAALGGFPQSLALKYLKQSEYYSFDQENRLFGGVYGFQNDSEHFALVGIRNIIWNKSQVTIHSGSGIVGKSESQKELTEIKNKKNIIESIFL